MTRDEALQAMIDGEKVTHRFFSDDEFIFMKGQNIFTEDGVNCGASYQEFWVDKGGRLGTEAWLSDWEIFE